MRSCISIRGCVCPSVTRELKPCKTAVFDQNYYQFEREGILCCVFGLVQTIQSYQYALEQLLNCTFEGSIIYWE